MTGYNDIMKIIKEIKYSTADKLENDCIIIDNYEDFLVGKTKISPESIEDVHDEIKDKKLKFFFIGRGCALVIC